MLLIGNDIHHIGKEIAENQENELPHFSEIVKGKVWTSQDMSSGIPYYALQSGPAHAVQGN